MKKEQIKSLLRQHSCVNNQELKILLTQYLPHLNISEKIEVLTQCAMLASRHGILSNLELLVKENPDILKEKQCGIFRVSAEIENIEDFKIMTDYLLESDKRHLIDVNALDSSFLKECIKREKLEYIQYLIEEKNIVFDFNNTTLIKTLLRYENIDILNYFIVDLKIPVEDKSLTDYMLENNYLDALEKMKKCNMFVKLANKLENKNASIKVKKI